MDAKELARLNGMIKRRLQIVDKGTSSYFIDSLNRTVDGANLIALDELNFFHDPRKSYSQFRLADILDLCGSQDLSRSEVSLLLGSDFNTATNDLDIKAMLEALRGGFGGSRTNAYVLGPSYFGKLESVTVPVAFYIIPKRIHQSISSSK